jgi:hypothetical protein
MLDFPHIFFRYSFHWFLIAFLKLWGDSSSLVYIKLKLAIQSKIWNENTASYTECSFLIPMYLAYFIWYFLTLYFLKSYCFLHFCFFPAHSQWYSNSNDHSTYHVLYPVSAFPHYFRVSYAASPFCPHFLSSSSRFHRLSLYLLPCIYL